MSDLRPPEPGAGPVEGPGAEAPSPSGPDMAEPADESTTAARGGPEADKSPPAPAVPPIDLSEPEVPELAVPDATDSPVAGPGDEAVPPTHGQVEAPPGIEVPTSPPMVPSDSTVPTDGATAPPLSPAASPGDGAGAGRDGPNLKLLIAIMALVTVALLGAVIYLVTRSDGGTTAATSTSTSSTTINTTPVDTSDWVTDTDEVSGFTLKRPKDWIVSSQPAGQNRLLLSAGEQNFLLVTARNVDPSTVTKEIQQAMSDLEIISGPNNLTIGGLPAVLYIYKTPITEDNREAGVIIHYFIVRNSKMYSMIFQARPKDELNRLARVFNAVTNSFKSTSDAPAPDPLPTTDTTVAGSTTSTTR